MSVVTELRKNVAEATPVMAVVGATDLAVERVRKAATEAGARRAELTTDLETRVTKVQVEVEKAVASLEPDYLQKFLAKTFDAKTLQAGAQQVPALAVSRALEVAGKVETGYESLAQRGKKLFTRVETQKATQDLVRQGKATLSRGKAAATTAQKAVEGTVHDAKATLTIGRKEVAEIAETLESDVVTGTRGTRAGIKRTASSARKSAASTKSAAKGATTSARKSAASASTAAKAAAEQVGDSPE